MCKYYKKQISEIPRPYNSILSEKHLCTGSFLDKKGNSLKFTSCIYFKSFEKCEHYVSKSIIETNV